MKTKEIILKESPEADEETLEHCLTAIQAMLDMDDFERAYNYLNSFVSEIIDQTREETIREVEEEIESWEKEDGKSFTSDKIKNILNKLKK
jgi:hypothetical protein